MKRSLRRLLQVRELVEDLAQLEWEAKSAQMRALEESARREGRMARAIQRNAVEDLTAEKAGRREDWRLNMADAGIAGWKEARLGVLAEAARPAVDRAREDLLVRRQERRQVEILSAAAAHAEEKREIRHDQNRTDDWFQSRSMRGNRRRR